MLKRRQFNQSEDLEQRLADEANSLREQAELLPHGPVRDEVLRRARQAETGLHISKWLLSPGLQAPR